MRSKRTACWAAAGVVAITNLSVVAGDYDSGKVILNDDVPALVTPKIDMRLRYEFGDADFLDESHAVTWRNRIGLLTRDFNGFQAYAEYEGTLAADRDDYFAPGTEFPTGQTPIADPESHELNQAWVSYTAPSDIWGLKVGRQGINLDNQRYVGTVGWRQNMQTFDAAGITWNPTDDIEIYYGYVWQVNRIFGSEAFLAPFTDFKGQSHLFNAKFKNFAPGTLTTYVYSLDLHNVAGDGNSCDTVGFSLAGDLIGDLDYYLEYAHQTDGSSSPLDYEANYAHAYLSSPIFSGVTGTVGYEYLGSDNGVGFNTPLATLHKFNGFADVFLNTPAGGISDVYASLGTKVAGFGISTAYHYFWDDGFDVAVGQEVDLVASKPITENVTLLAKAAWFDGFGGQADVARAIVELNIKY